MKQLIEFKKKKFIRKRIYTYNDSFFENIDSEIKAYWLGFLYADGCVGNILRTPTISLGLSIKDVNHVQKFVENINCNAPIHIHTPKNKEYRYSIGTVNIYSEKMAKDLIYIGCVPNKTSILDFPSVNEVPEHLLNHFIRGYFDGDGCLYLGKRRDVEISILSTYHFLFKLNIILNKLAKTEFQRIEKVKNRNVFRYRFSSVINSIKFLNFIYNNATLYLERKYNKYLEFKNSIDKED